MPAIAAAPFPAPATAVPAGRGDSPERVLDAARQFEALLVGQIMRSMREGGSGWLGTGEEDAAGSAATDFAEQQFASTLSAQGGLGLASLITAGLTRER